jgi:glutathione S-transferase
MAMLTLRSSPSSPFARKVRIAMRMLGLADTIRVENTDTMDPKDSVRRQNPLGKIPVLILEDGTALYDSRVILEYLDDRAGGGRIIPRAGAERFAALHLQAIGDGIMDAGVLQIYEQRWRPEARREPRWVEHQAGKIARALDLLEQEPPPLAPMIHVGHITLASALGYLDFRFGEGWRAGHPRLVQWLGEFAAKVPAFAETKPQ